MSSPIANTKAPTPGRVVNLGRLVATAAVAERIAPESIARLLKRHTTGDWGDLDELDWQTNENVADDPNGGGRLFSSYRYAALDRQGDPVEAIWIITDDPHGQPITTVLLPEDY